MKLIIFILAFFAAILSNAQTKTEISKAQSELQTYNEVVISFDLKDASDVFGKSQALSVSLREGKHVVAYLNTDQFNTFLNEGLPFKVITRSNNNRSTSAATVALTLADMANWDQYPSYDVYIEMMEKFATDYPEICKLISIGKSTNGRDILAVKISDNVNDEENEPEFFYTAQMHGNEIMTYVLMLRFIDHLLSNYATSTEVANLVDQIEIYINPLANPDGTFAGGNNDVTNSTRENAQNKNLNADFPVIGTEELPEENAATETKAFKAFARSRHFVMAANLHTGYEVVNYAWDKWTTNDPYGSGYPIRPHADDAWWQYVSAIYASKAQADGAANGLSSYLTGVNSKGWTEGGDWAVIDGSRQDYATYFTNCRETTLELYNGFILDATKLPIYWGANKQALLDYMQEVLFGFRGVITDEISGKPITAKVEIVGHDTDNSFVFSSLPVGNYHRPIIAGTYDVTFSAAGYHSKTIQITAVNNDIKVENVSLIPVNIGVSEYESPNMVKVYPLPSSGIVNIVNIESYSDLTILDVQGRIVYKQNIENNSLELDLTFLSKGVYILSMHGDKGELKKRLILE